MRSTPRRCLQSLLHDVQAAIELKPVLASSPLQQRRAFLVALRADLAANHAELARANRHDCEAFTQQTQVAVAVGLQGGAPPPLASSSSPLTGASSPSSSSSSPLRPQSHTASQQQQQQSLHGRGSARWPVASVTTTTTTTSSSSGAGEPGTGGEVLGPFYQSAFTSRPSHCQQLLPLRFDKAFSVIDYLLEQPDPIALPQDCWLKAEQERQQQRQDNDTRSHHDNSSNDSSDAIDRDIDGSTATPTHTTATSRLCPGADLQVEVCEVRVPLGLVGVLSRYRPRMLLDATAMGVFAGNTLLMDGGASLYCTNTALISSVRRALVAVDLPAASVVYVESYDAQSSLTARWLRMADRVDMGLVCGPPKLYDFACRNASIPLIRATSRSCSLLVDESAVYDTALRVILNAKQQSPGAANAITTVILHAQFPRYGELLQDLVEHGVALLGDYAARERAPECIFEIASDEEYRGLSQGLRDFSQTLCVKSVDSVDQALFFLDLFGSKQADGIIASDEAVIADYCNRVDSAVVLVNASTRLSSGGPLGCGPDLANATSKVHCRGPVTLSALTTRKFIVRSRSEGGAFRK